MSSELGSPGVLGWRTLAIADPAAGAVPPKVAESDQVAPSLPEIIWRRVPLPAAAKAREIVSASGITERPEPGATSPAAVTWLLSQCPPAHFHCQTALLEP